MSDEERYATVIYLRAVYDDSDIMTDYYNPDRTLLEWYVCDLPGKMVTESKLRRALGELPGWLQRYTWEYLRPAKYSMSSHYYGQLRMRKGTGLTIKNYAGYNAAIGFILTVTSKSCFLMNNKLETPIPETFTQFEYAFHQKLEERREREIEIRQHMIEHPYNPLDHAHAVIDEHGFRILKRPREE